MSRPTTSFPQFQDYIWSQIPERQRDRVGREMVNDLVSVVVQEWPDEQLSQANPKGSAELEALGELRKTAARHLQLAYGDEKASEMSLVWMFLLQFILPIVLEKTLEWWRKRKENRGRIRIWRRKWVNDTEE
jgi:hypothetical protein